MPTLARMPLVEKNPTPTDTAPADPFAWDPDPLVLVSRRARILYFPKVLATRDATEKERAQWRGEESSSVRRQEEQISVNAGVTFLGCYTTSWADLDTAQGNARGVPDPSKMILVEPFTRARDLITGDRSNRDQATGRLLPARVQAIYRRIFEYHRAEAEAGRTGARNPWETENGFDGPEMQLIRLSDVFAQRTEAGQQAHATITATIPHLRRNPHESVTPVGALHDYAIRHRGGRSILDACRTWAVRKKIG